ncbi:hypothetical protein AUP74_01592 [Microbulbifer aggregans]|uniref:DUF3604 domain-containing protein n=1 Tax=Microbulbifer aggregans TaxID=1769779 RepID=A0A1C9W7A1_9GAMM|nr:DUF3604 domain-containing protein [Microbulbifer aggregans]AOS97027.1 hypothetical protein AUP74_01592 [Microbulbifer aggregans]
MKPHILTSALLTIVAALTACGGDRGQGEPAQTDSGSGQIIGEEFGSRDAPVSEVDEETNPYAATDSDDSSTGDANKATADRGDYPTTAYFGDTHVHTGWSADAGMDGAILTPEDAYRFALGEEVDSNSGVKAKLHRPYDWFMITDHSDGMGVINEIIAGNPAMMEDPTIKKWSEALNSGDPEQASAAKSELITMQSEERLPKQVMDPKWMKSAWEKTVAAAEKFYKPGEFSTFIAFEWTVNADGGNNLHRNVIFRDGADRIGDLLPLTTFETQDPMKLWQWMQAYEQKTGGQVLAIPHNGNLSNGRMFEEQQFDGSPMTSEWAQMRAKYEPLFEVTQIKGQSESHPSLSPEDEFANWDLWDRGNLILVPKPEGAIKTEYWREALKSGMRLQDELGTNPFEYGANAATDTHTGLSTTEEDNFFGKFKTLEPSNKTRWNYPLLEGKSGDFYGWEQAASGVMGVWAKENTREAIWDAMKRKETFATTGPRMTLRFFGGYDFTEQDAKGDIAAAGYEKGVPMGARLSAAKEGQPMTFLVAAMKDPEGANLDRVQIIKGWVDGNGKAHEKIFNVTWSGDRTKDGQGAIQEVGNSVNLETAEYTNDIGASQLMGYFVDEEFNPDHKAVYYVRVLEIPTPRWTLYDKVRFDVEMDKDVPLTHQERGFSSPIWYTP